MVIFEIVSDRQHTPLIRAYLPLSTLDHLPYLEESLNRLLWRESIVIGDLSADIGRLKNPRSQQMADSLVSFGLVNLIRHFSQRLHFCHIKVCWQV